MAGLRKKLNIGARNGAGGRRHPQSARRAQVRGSPRRGPPAIRRRSAAGNQRTFAGPFRVVTGWDVSRTPRCSPRHGLMKGVLTDAPMSLLAKKSGHPADDPIAMVASSVVQPRAEHWRACDRSHTPGDRGAATTASPQMSIRLRPGAVHLRDHHQLRPRRRGRMIARCVLSGAHRGTSGARVSYRRRSAHGAFDRSAASGLGGRSKPPWIRTAFRTGRYDAPAGRPLTIRPIHLFEWEGRAFTVSKANCRRTKVRWDVDLRAH